MKKVIALVALASTMMMAATAGTLAVGSKAPTLAADKWIKGDAVKKFEPGTVYVVEFWATWCGPCIQAIPHLTEIQKKYGDKVVVIGVAGAERKPPSGPDTRFEKVKTFVEGKGAQMDYRVVFDGSNASWAAWMKAAKKDGIPCTFIVDHTGKLGYIGHPMQMDAPLEAIVKKAPAKSTDDKRGAAGKSGKGEDSGSTGGKKGSGGTGGSAG